MKRIGLTLITLAFLVGAYLSVLDPVTLAWPWYGAIVLFGFVGVALVRVADRGHAGSDETLKANTAQLRDSLETIIRKVEELEAAKHEIFVYDLPKTIDRALLDPFNNFVSVRDTMKVAYGLEGFAAVMGPYAGGERYMNRVWSASADGYIDEAHEYIGRSLEQFRIAQDKLSALEAQAS